MSEGFGRDAYCTMTVTSRDMFVAYVCISADAIHGSEPVRYNCMLYRFGLYRNGVPFERTKGFRFEFPSQAELGGYNRDSRGKRGRRRGGSMCLEPGRE